jgi:hypothetical protein
MNVIKDGDNYITKYSALEGNEGGIVIKEKIDKNNNYILYQKVFSVTNDKDLKELLGHNFPTAENYLFALAEKFNYRINLS